MVHVYDEQVVHSIVPLTDAPEVTGFGADARAQIEAMSFDQRLEVFSKKNSPFNLGEIPAE
jgi:hypothetical protein